MAKEKLFAVFGLGTFGLEVCRVLALKGGKVIAIDNDPQKIERVKTTATQAILLDSSDEEILRNAPVDDIDVAIIGIGENLEASILTTALLKKRGVPLIIARAISDIHAQVLKQVGASEVINIEIEEGKRVASRLISPDIIDKVYIGKSQILAEVVATKAFVGKSLLELDLRKRTNVNIISIKRVQTTIDEMGNPVQDEVVSFPNPSTVIEKGDVLVVVGIESDVERMKDL
jgi:trk system potassium uptake protein TrkA